MQIVSWYLTVLRHFVVPRTAGNQVIILEAQVEGFFQWFDMMHAQAFAIIGSAGIRPITAFVAHPADVIIPIQNVAALPLPRGRKAKTVCGCIFSFPVSGSLRTDLTNLVYPSAI